MHRDLKADVLEVLDNPKLEFVPLSEEEAVGMGYNISQENPVFTTLIPGGWRIYILKSLNAFVTAEMVAHELMHLLLKGEGLFAVTYDWEDAPEQNLAQEMNSVIFHHFMLDRLLRDYGITSSLHLKLRKSILEKGSQILEEYADETIMLHSIGLHLLDLSICTVGFEKEIDQLLGLSLNVRRSFELGREFLVYSRPDLSVEEQWQRISEFLKRLGYEPGDARLTG